jgi:copper(I)-binding protein
MNLRSLLLGAAFTMAGATAFAHSYDVGDLHIQHPHARPTVANMPTGAAYLNLENKGKSADKLLSASTPVAKSVEIHTMSMDNGVMKMREVGTVDLKPGEKIEMKPGSGYHLMLMGLTQQLKPGDRFPMTLTFEKAGKKEVSVAVDKAGDAEHQH